MRKLLYTLIIFVFLISGCDNSTAKVTTSVEYFISAYNDDDQRILTQPFGSYITLIGYNKSKINKLSSYFNNEMIRMHELFDSNYYYKKDGHVINNLKVINDNYGVDQFIKIDDDLFDVLKTGIEFSLLSRGKFNIAIGSIVNLWDDSFDVLSINYKKDPSFVDVNSALRCVPTYEQLSSVLVLNETKKEVKFLPLEGCDGKVVLTLGGLAKGYAVEKIAKDERFKDGPYLLDGGSSSIAAMGRKPDKENWKILVPVSNYTPTNAGEDLFQVSKNSSFALSTSNGDINGYTNDDGIRRHHIIDATNGYPANYYYSVSVVGDNSLYADIITTTITSMNSVELNNYIIALNEKNITVGLLLQTEEDGQLVVRANKEMKELKGISYQIDILDL